jgi:hypothetical protein
VVRGTLELESAAEQLRNRPASTVTDHGMGPPSTGWRERAKGMRSESCSVADGVTGSMRQYDDVARSEQTFFAANEEQASASLNNVKVGEAAFGERNRPWRSELGPAKHSAAHAQRDEHIAQ